MRILLLTDEMLPGGVSRHVTDLANGLAGRGHWTVVAATDGPARTRLAKGVEFLDLSMLKPDALEKHFIGIMSALPRLQSFIRAQNIDIIHSHKRLSDVVARFVARRTGISHVSTCHGNFNTLKLLSRFGDETIASSEATRRVLIESFGKDPSRVHTIHLGIKPLPHQTSDEVEKCRNRLGVAGKRIIASVGRLEKAKDRLTLLRAIEILKRDQQLEDFVFVVVGDGPERGMLLSTIQKIGIGSSVLLLDSSTNVVDIFNAAEFCVISSVREGGTLYVNLEAASLGKPHVATNVGGIPEFVVDGETGLLVPPQSPEKLAAAIAKLIHHPEEVQRLGRNAFTRCMKNHGYDRFIDETMKVYEKVLEDKASHPNGEAVSVR